jgi:alkylation response protein AidB-like acyl-CoA dehydrogenase
MNKTLKRMPVAALALLAGSAALFVGDISVPSGWFIGQAEARVGRPATPLSYAGVARRTTRRAAAYGAAGAAAAGTYHYARPGCRQVADAHGRVVYHCP